MTEYLERDSYVLCPICKKEKFNKKNSFIFCNHCGWEGDLESDEKFIGINGLSIKDYKKIYQEYLKINSKFIWKKDKNAINNYIDSFHNYGPKCPVCGEESMEPDYRYCYKCGWKYNLVQAQFPEFNDSSNILSLDEYRKEYEKIYQENPSYLWKDTDNVRIPLTEEQLKWLSENEINTNFNKLTRDVEIRNIIESLYSIQKESETKEEYLFIRTIIETILDNI